MSTPLHQFHHDDQFLDWLTQSDDLMSGVDPKLNESSKKMILILLKILKIF